ncbi:MAG TPA: RDD family protein [Puia sp.]|nr:RDD family protein [Puia sp.]
MSTLQDILDAKQVALIGSSPGNDIVFNDPDTSAHHCQISKIGDDKYLIVDLNSSSGTFVNNRRVEKEFITGNDFISVGNNIFQLGKRVSAPVATPGSSSGSIPSTQPAAPAVQQQAASPVSSSIRNEPTAEPASQDYANTAGKTKSKISVYFLAAPEDESVCQAIDKHLSTIRFSTPLPIEINGDFKIPPGENIAAYKQKLFDADIVLAFISVDFLNNDGCYERIKKVIVNHNNRKTILLPILARNCMWKATPFANLPLLPKNHQPLNNKQFWNSEDDALTAVVNDIYKSIHDFTGKEAGEKSAQKQLVMPKLDVEWRKSYLWTVFWKRVAASILDGFIIGIPLGLIFYLGIAQGPMREYAYEKNYYGGASFDLTAEIFLYYLLVAAIQIVIYAFMESSSWRGTPGKLIMKLQITDNAGNPISFGKSVIRNIIKWVITAFASVATPLFIVYMIAQVISYAITKKFFHDQLSNTVIGERLK